MNESHDWMLTLGFAVNVPASAMDEFTVGSVWGPGVVEWVRFARASSDVAIRAYVMAGRLPLREGLVPDVVMPGEMVVGTVVDVTLARRAGSLFSVTGEETEIPLGRVVPWECWSLILQLDNLGAAGRDVYGHFVIRVLGHPVLPVPAFYEREMAPHVALLAARAAAVR